MEEKIWDCIIKRLTGNETPISKIDLENWLTKDTSNQLKYNNVKSLWILTGEIPAEKSKVSFNSIKPLVTAHYIEPETKKLNLWKYGIAASIAIICAWTYFVINKPKALTDQEWVIKKTTAGQTMQLILPDSSKVWLNAGTEISFAKNFTQHKLRKIKLKGEAYFEVKHDGSHPFVVENDQFITTVYGTSFNISAYPKENLATVAVNSGKVGVLKTGLKSKQPMMLLPNDRLVYNHNLKTFVKSNIAIGDVNSWVKGELVFEQTTVSTVFGVLSRKFNVTIEADQTKYKDCKLTARFQNQSLKEILTTLEQVLNIKTKQIKQTIYIEGGTSCN